MAQLIHERPDILADALGISDIELHFVFANTGMEHNDTLRFVRDLTTHGGIPITWVETVISPEKGVGSVHREVSFETCFRNDQWEDPKHPYHATAAKYGIPNVSWMSCTREMKLRPMQSLMRSRGYRGFKSHHTCIGIREDENRRVSKRAGVDNLVYPLVDIWPTTKEEVLEHWEAFDWDLNIEEWEGNCMTCYKKSLWKLANVHGKHPEAFEFHVAMERLYSRAGVEHENNPNDPPRVTFRKNIRTKDLIELFKTSPEIKTFHQAQRHRESPCSGQCEMFETEWMS
jgi:hypothetical protein